MSPLRGLGLGRYTVSIDIPSLRDWPLVQSSLFFSELGLCEKYSEKSEMLWETVMNPTETVQTIVFIGISIKLDTG